MFASLLIVFREALEAGLIVGIVLAATRGEAGRGSWIVGGIGAGLVGALLVASFAATISGAFQGAGQEVFTASVLGLATVMLAWHNTWMAGHGKEIALRVSAMGAAVKDGEPLLPLAFLVAIAVLREGFEVVLFLYGIVLSSHENTANLFAGGILGLAAAGSLSYLIYRGLLVIPIRQMFTVTNVLLTLLAAGMAGQAAAVLGHANILPTLGDHLWDTSFLLREDGWVGHALRSLVGYSARPSGIQMVAYVGTLFAFILLTWGARMRGSIGNAATPKSSPQI